MTRYGTLASFSSVTFDLLKLFRILPLFLVSFHSVHRTDPDVIVVSFIDLLLVLLLSPATTPWHILVMLISCSFNTKSIQKWQNSLPLVGRLCFSVEVKNFYEAKRINFPQRCLCLNNFQWTVNEANGCDEEKEVGKKLTKENCCFKWQRELSQEIEEMSWKLGGDYRWSLIGATAKFMQLLN